MRYRLYHLHAPLRLCAVLLFAAIATGLLAFAATRGEATETMVAAQPVEGGILLLRGKGVATDIPAVQLGTDMKVSVSGAVARVTVTQAYSNQSGRWVEATYLYPLPENSAVDAMKMVVGDRVIIGRIKRREEAREIYETAREEGKKAGLVEQERANMFRNSVANVGPGETVLVQIEYQMPVLVRADTYSLRLPQVVGPRYVPPRIAADRSQTRGIAAATAPIAHPDLASTTPGGKLNPVSIRVDLDAGFAIGSIDSPYHKVDVSGSGARRSVSLTDGTVPADRDFVLNWRPKAKAPSLSIYHQQLGNRDYVMAMIAPPARSTALPNVPRELVFVIDNSGSMAGDSMEQAKQGLLHALTTLKPGDRFNIIRFDDTMTELFATPVAATTANLAKARAYASRLEAEGGTEMVPALEEALLGQGAVRRGAIRQIIFLTDGDIYNEDEMFRLLADGRGASRVFMIGIGSAPNNYLMARMAEMGRGDYLNIGDTDEVTARIQGLLDRLGQPVLRDLKLKVAGSDAEFTPRELPDLYAGQPLMLIGRASDLGGTLEVSGMLDDTPWSQTLRLGSAVDSDAIGKLWARQKVADTEVEEIFGRLSYQEASDAIARLGLDFSLVTRETSLVAIDETPSRPADQPLTLEDLPLNLPAGWSFDHLFGGDAAKAARANRLAMEAELASDGDNLDLPDTATGFAGMAGRGLALLLLALVGLALLRRRVGA